MSEVGAPHQASSLFETSKIDPGNWEDLHALRVRALEDSPLAFLGDRGEETSRTPSEWKLECSRGFWFKISTAGRDIGVGKVSEYPEEIPRFHLEGMWVDPGDRKSGVGAALLQFAEDYVRRRGDGHLGLWIVVGNDVALHLYKSRGYVPTGREGFLPDGRPEVEYHRDLRHP